jgi:hydroxymethylpyrimidine/phosphomethylpyrimidine kinase
MENMPIALTIAGSDPCAGAGIQADLKTFAALGVYGVCVITAVTSQNTSGVQGIYRLPPEVVSQQLESVLDDFSVAAVKTGMLWDGLIIKEVAEKIRKFSLRQLVIDPVICAGDGTRLLQEEALSILKQKLLPLAYLITPNIYEAEVLCGFNLGDLEDMRCAARKIQQLGCARVLIKGGHLPGDEAIDLLYDGQAFTTYSRPRLKGQKWHGTGCTLSAAVTAGLAQGKTLTEAVGGAIKYNMACIERADKPGRGGYMLINHFRENL